MSGKSTGMVTEVYLLKPETDWDAALLSAGAALRRGQLVAFPTETVYGLGADALNPDAVRRIFIAKGRPQDNPLIVHVPDVAGVLPLVASVSNVFYCLAEAFWPGPLTMVLPRSTQVPDVTTAGLDSVAVRVPDHPVAQSLLRSAGLPVAAPSANRSGRPSPTRAEHVLTDLEGQVAVVLDGGPTGVGVESTVLDLTSHVPTVLRPGGVTLEQLREVLGVVDLDPRANALPSDTPDTSPVRSPGMKYRHYAPVAPAVMIEGEPPYIWQQIRNLVYQDHVKRPGLLVTDEGLVWMQNAGLPENVVVYTLGPRRQVDEAARRIFAALRQLDSAGVDSIYIEGVPASGIGLAVMNRLRRAVGGRIIMANR